MVIGKRTQEVREVAEDLSPQRHLINSVAIAIAPIVGDLSAITHVGPFMAGGTHRSLADAVAQALEAELGRPARNTADAVLLTIADSQRADSSVKSSRGLSIAFGEAEISAQSAAAADPQRIALSIGEALGEDVPLSI